MGLCISYKSNEKKEALNLLLNYSSHVFHSNVSSRNCDLSITLEQLFVFVTWKIILFFSVPAHTRKHVLSGLIWWFFTAFTMLPLHFCGHFSNNICLVSKLFFSPANTLGNTKEISSSGWAACQMSIYRPASCTIIWLHFHTNFLCPFFVECKHLL